MKLLTSCLVLAVAPAALALDPTALRGIKASDIDRGAEACTDFYQFANGAWRAANPIPASMTRWSRRWQAGEAAKERLKGILDEVSASRAWAPGGVEQLIGDHYASCVDEARIESLGLTPLKPLLAEIDALGDVAGVQRMIGRFHEMAINVPFGVASAPDNHEPSQVIANVYAAGLGLPDRDYYVKTEPRFQEAREKYRAHVAKMFALAGASADAAGEAADTVFATEKALAEASLDNVALRDPAATDHKMTFAELQALAPRFDWAAYFDAARISRADLNVQEPKFLQGLDRRLAETPLPAWRTYLKWHLLHAAAPSLSAPFVEETFDFYSRYLGGAREMKPRWKRCAESTDALLGEALGRKYVEKYFPPVAKARMQELVRNLLLAMGDIIRGLDWMGEETKQKALEKLSTFNPKIGYPDKWRAYSAVAIQRDEYWANVVAGSRYNVEDDGASSAATRPGPSSSASWSSPIPTRWRSTA